MAGDGFLLSLWKKPTCACNDALHVIGLYGPEDLSFLAAGKGGIDLSRGPGHAVSGNA